MRSLHPESPQRQEPLHGPGGLGGVESLLRQASQEGLEDRSVFDFDLGQRSTGRFFRQPGLADCKKSHAEGREADRGRWGVLQVDADSPSHLDLKLDPRPPLAHQQRHQQREGGLDVRDAVLAAHNEWAVSAMLPALVAAAVNLRDVPVDLRNWVFVAFTVLLLATSGFHVYTRASDRTRRIRLAPLGAPPTHLSLLL